MEYCDFCDVNYRAIVKHVNTRWLSLERAVHRVLQQYCALKSYFLSEGLCYIDEIVFTRDIMNDHLTLQ